MRTVAVRLCNCELPPVEPERYSLLSATIPLAVVRARVPVADARGACLQPKGIGPASPNRECRAVPRTARPCSRRFSRPLPLAVRSDEHDVKAR
jgi:hypothetical protein